MAIQGSLRTFYKKFSFVVEIQDVGYAGFQEMSDLAFETEVVEQREGGRLAPFKEPGTVSFDDLTLSRGATADLDLFEWAREVSDAVKNRGLPSPQHLRAADVLQLDRDRTILRRWAIPRCFPMRFVAGQWDNNASENVIETIVLAIESFEPRPGGGTVDIF